ncbi:MAG TPA: TetR/AcrR family transcriptional regulator [Longimicrobiales bacterium]|nr:TetR/AcrR family transcriptional regulator [Longimicrobiales bacterium]
MGDDRRAGQGLNGAENGDTGGGGGREGEDLRQRIMSAAGEIVGNQGLDALSMRAIALRIGYSPATIYLYFRDKDELLGQVMNEGFHRLEATMRRELMSLPEGATSLEQYRATGKAYARFALENTGYFQAMFRQPKVPNLIICPEPREDRVPGEEAAWDFGLTLVERVLEDMGVPVRRPEHVAMAGWGMVHGMVSLYLGGHLSEHVPDNDSFMELLGEAIETFGRGWRSGSP